MWQFSDVLNCFVYINNGYTLLKNIDLCNVEFIGKPKINHLFRVHLYNIIKLVSMK